MVNPALFQYWDTDEAPSYVVELTDTFRDLNPDLDHRLLSASQAEDFIAAHFGTRERDAFAACAVPAMQSDYFRYCAVLAMGGIYSDVDYICVTALRPLLERAEGGELFHRNVNYSLLGRRRVRAVLNSFFAFGEPGHPFLRLALDIATANVEARIPERLWGAGQNVRLAVTLTSGPGIFSVMRLIHMWGSLEAFTDEVAGSPVEPFAELYCEVIGDYDRIVEAFEGIRFSPIERMHEWIVSPSAHLPYKKTETHWANFKQAIFNDAPLGFSSPPQ